MCSSPSFDDCMIANKTHS